MLFGTQSTEVFSKTNILLFGLGGVGSYCAEALSRAGIGSITIVDNDVVSLSNINRQLCALHSTIGLKKTDVIGDRIIDINPNCNVIKSDIFFTPENSDCIDFSAYDYIIDAIDTVSSKIEIIKKSKNAGVPVISCMGTGNKINPDLFKISDISKTSVCPLCRVMRYELRKLGLNDVDVLWSDEIPKKNEMSNQRVPGSLPFVPSVAGLLIAGYVIKKVICNEK